MLRSGVTDFCRRVHSGRTRDARDIDVADDTIGRPTLFRNGENVAAPFNSSKTGHKLGSLIVCDGIPVKRLPVTRTSHQL